MAKALQREEDVGLAHVQIEFHEVLAQMLGLVIMSISMLTMI